MLLSGTWLRLLQQTITRFRIINHVCLARVWLIEHFGAFLTTYRYSFRSMVEAVVLSLCLAINMLAKGELCGRSGIVSEARLPGAISLRAKSPVATEPLESTVKSHLIHERIEQWTASHRVGIPAAAAASESAVTTTEVQPGLLELDRETFHDYIAAAADRTVVVDFYTNRCGPCKLIYPELVKLSEALAPAASIVKFNCSQANKELASALGIKVVPTFQIYKGGVKVAEMTGAKLDKLRALIDAAINQN